MLEDTEGYATWYFRAQQDFQLKFQPFSFQPVVYQCSTPFIHQGQSQQKTWKVVSSHWLLPLRPNGCAWLPTPGWATLKSWQVMASEHCSKPLLVDDCMGLYYPLYIGDYHMNLESLLMRGFSSNCSSRQVPGFDAAFQNGGPLGAEALSQSPWHSLGMPRAISCCLRLAGILPNPQPQLQPLWS